MVSATYQPGPIARIVGSHKSGAAVDTLLWLGLIAGFGALAWVLRGSGWAVPAFLAYGALYGERLILAGDNGRFDLRTGEPMRKPVKEPLRVYPVELRNGRIIVEHDSD